MKRYTHIPERWEGRSVNPKLTEVFFIPYQQQQTTNSTRWRLLDRWTIQIRCIFLLRCVSNWKIVFVYLFFSFARFLFLQALGWNRYADNWQLGIWSCPVRPTPQSLTCLLFVVMRTMRRPFIPSQWSGDESDDVVESSTKSKVKFFQVLLNFSFFCFISLRFRNFSLPRTYVRALRLECALGEKML